MSDGERGEESFLAVVRGGWRITVPVEVRRKLGVKLGDLVRVRFRKEEPRPT